MRGLVAARLRWLLIVGLVVANLVFFALGVIAAVVGGDLAILGRGAGGLDGWADLSITFFSLTIGLAAAIATFRERRSILGAFGVFATGILVGVGFLNVAHLADPCVRGWFDAASTFDNSSLCGGGDIAQRFHLLLHGAFGALSAGVAAVIYRRRSLFAWWPPGGQVRPSPPRPAHTGK